jgi:hypothetical protein
MWHTFSSFASDDPKVTGNAFAETLEHKNWKRRCDMHTLEGEALNECHRALSPAGRGWAFSLCLMAEI